MWQWGLEVELPRGFDSAQDAPYRLDATMWEDTADEDAIAASG